MIYPFSEIIKNLREESVNYYYTRSSTICEILGDRFAEDTIDIEYEEYDHVSLEEKKKWKSSLTIRDLLRHQGGFPPGPHYYNDRYDHAT